MAEQGRENSRTNFSRDSPKDVSRRDFIKGVIVRGVAVSSAGYLFRASSLLHGQHLGAVERTTAHA